MKQPFDSSNDNSSPSNPLPSFINMGLIIFILLAIITGPFLWKRLILERNAGSCYLQSSPSCHYKSIKRLDQKKVHILENVEIPTNDQEPQPLNIHEIRIEIGYPTLARDAGISGDLELRILISKEGNYVTHRITKSIHPILLHAVESKVHKLRFKPAIQEGRPVPAWINIPFSFKLVD